MKSPLGLEAQLPVFELFKDAVFLLWSKRNRLLTMFLPLIIVLVVFERYTSDLQLQIQTNMVALQQAGIAELPEGFARFLLLSVVSMLLSVLLATTVHRFSLQEPSQWPSSALRLPTRYDFRYLGRTVQIILICMAGAMMTSIVGVMVVPVLGLPQNDPASFLVILIPVMLVVLYLMSRLSVTLPEIALGVKGSDLGRAWRMSKGNGTRLLVVVLALPAMVNMPFLILYTVDSVVANVIASFGVYFMTLISITVLSLSYQFLLEFYEPGDGEEVQPEAKPEDNGLDA